MVVSVAWWFRYTRYASTQPPLSATPGEGTRRDADYQNQTYWQLVEQVQKPVRFEECVRRAVAQGTDCVVEVGAGSSLAKLIRRIDKSVRCLPVYDRESFEKCLAELAIQG